MRDPLLLVMADIEVKLIDHLREGRQSGTSPAGQGLSTYELGMYCQQVVQGVQYLHGRGVIHRNLAT